MPHQASPHNRISLTQTIGSSYISRAATDCWPRAASLQSALILGGSGIERSCQESLLCPHYCFGGEVAGGPPVG